MLGNGRLEAMCFDGQKRLCHIRGKLRKKVWINQSDIILVRDDPYSGLFLVGLGLVLRLERLRSIEKVGPLAYAGNAHLKSEGGSISAADLLVLIG